MRSIGRCRVRAERWPPRRSIDRATPIPATATASRFASGSSRRGRPYRADGTRDPGRRLHAAAALCRLPTRGRLAEGGNTLPCSWLHRSTGTVTPREGPRRIRRRGPSRHTPQRQRRPCSPALRRRAGATRRTQLCFMAVVFCLDLTASITVCAACSGSSCSHTRMTSQPTLRSASLVSVSRARFPAIFSCQNAAPFLAGRWCSGQPCQ